MTIRIGILGNPDGWYVHDLKRAAAGERIEVVSFRDLALRSDGRGGVSVQSQTISDPASTDSSYRNLTPGREPAVAMAYDALLIRTMPMGSLEQIIFRMNALHSIHRRGVPVVNAPRCLEIAIDKWLTLDCLQAAGLPTPKTYCFQTRADAMVGFEEMGGSCVVKPLFGGEGRGLVHVTDPDIAWRVFGAIEQISGIIYMQEYLEHPGFDLRLLVIGEEVFGVQRHANNDWRTNVSRGGTAKAYEPTPSEIALAIRAARTIGGDIVGVDLLPTIDGRLELIEVNAVPGWRGTAQALGVDIARVVLDRLRSSLRASATKFPDELLF